MITHEPQYFKLFREHIDKRFDEMNGKFTLIDHRFDEINGRFTLVDNRFGEIDRKFDMMDKRFDETNQYIATSVSELAVITNENFIRTEERFEEQRAYMDGKFATKLDLYESEVRLGNKIEKLDEKLVRIDGYIGRYEVRAQNLEETVLKDHKPRIEKLEELAAGI